MDLERLRAHCLARPGTSEGRPFGPDALVMKVGGKIFAIVADQTQPARVGNTVTLDGTVADEDPLGCIDDSSDLAVDGLPRVVRAGRGMGTSAHARWSKPIIRRPSAVDCTPNHSRTRRETRCVAHGYAAPPCSCSCSGGAPTTEDAADAEATTVSSAESPVGEVLVDGEGMALSLFENDEQGESTCTDDCAATWPPLTTSGEPTAEGGVDQGALGTITREDGSTQVTYNDWPLSHYADDSEPGDTADQGIGEVW